MKNNYVAVILISSILINTSCHKDDVKQDETPPILSCTPVALSTVSSFIAFGADLSATQKNPAFEYLVNSDSVHVRISSSGKVERIFLNDNFFFRFTIRALFSLLTLTVILYSFTLIFFIIIFTYNLF